APAQSWPAGPPQPPGGESTDAIDSLEEEMAKLLGRPLKPDGS
ncbi:MAG: flagellar biosynthesis protein FliO, partial [Methylobacteriaceae bacterium]|nr:flagellar biosynthesis protein FliO [Methylobacteriaceae bacterium]